VGKLRYHHLGIPTDVPGDGAVFLPQFGMYVPGYDTDPYGIEWIRLTECSPIPGLVKTIPHIAFESDDLLLKIKGKSILIEPNSPSEGVTVAFTVQSGAPTEFLQYSKRGDQP